jgi:hypothetical protein
MILSAPLKVRLLQEHGIFATESCDRCGQLLGAARFTRAGDPGVWCSRKCRDGIAHACRVCQICGALLNGKRRGAMYCSDRCRKRSKAQSPGLSNYRGMPSENKRVTSAILGSGYGDSRKPENAHIAERPGCWEDSKL